MDINLVNLVYSNFEPYKKSDEKSVFLVGPTPRSKEVVSWRKEAVDLFLKHDFKGSLLIPETTTGGFADYFHQVNWEREGLFNCTNIMAWVPRNMQNMPALTTNIELGYWLAKNPQKVIYGRPDNAPHTCYLDWLYKLENGNDPFNDLNQMIKFICAL